MILFPQGYKGLADSKWSGPQGSVAKSVGIDSHSKPGVITVNQALAKDSGATIDALCKTALPLSDGSKLWFSSESGKIWRDVDGTYTLVHTLVPVTDYTENGTAIFYPGMTKETGTMYTLFDSDPIISFSMGVTLSPSGSDVPKLTADEESDGSSNSTTIQLGITVPDEDNQVMIIIAGTYGNESTDSITSNVDATVTVTNGQGNSGAFDIGYRIVRITNPTVGSHILTATYAASVADRFIFAAVFKDVDQTTPVADTEARFGLTNNPTTHSGSVASSDLKSIAVIDLPGTIDNQVRLCLVASEFDTYTLGPKQVEISSDEIGTSYSHSFQYKNFKVGDANILGAAEYSSLIDDSDVSIGQYVDELEGNLVSHVYFCNEHILWKIALSDIASWTDNIRNVGLFSKGDDTYHPMLEQNNDLYIGDNTVIAKVDSSGTFTSESELSLAEIERITTLQDFDVDILVGTKRINDGRVLRWDGISESISAQDTVYEKEGVTAFIRDDNYVYAAAGLSGRLYFYDGEKLVLYKRIPGDWSPTKQAIIHANSVGFLRGIPVFGLSNSTGNPTEQGVYTLGSYSKDYNKILDLGFPISSGEFSGVEIGAIIVDGADMYVSWKGASNQGVDKLNYSAKYASAYIETLQITPLNDRSKLKSVIEFIADYVSLPTSTNIGFKYKKKYETNFSSALTVVNDTKLMQLLARSTVPEVASLQARIDFTVNSNDAPEVENFNIIHANEKQ